MIKLTTGVPTFVITYATLRDIIYRAQVNNQSFTWVAAKHSPKTFIIAQASTRPCRLTIFAAQVWVLFTEVVAELHVAEFLVEVERVVAPFIFLLAAELVD